MSLFRFAPSRGPRWQLGVQAAIGMSVPIAVMTLLGHPTLGFIAGSGAFTVLFAGAAPVVERARVLPFVAAGLVVGASLGAFAAESRMLVNIGIVVIALISAALCFGFRLGPPGPIFFVLVFGLSAQIVAHDAITPLIYVATIAAGCAFSSLVALSPLLIRRVRSHPARTLRELLPGPSLDDASQMLLLRVVIVAVLGVVIGAFVDPVRSYWIVGAGIAVIGIAADRRAGRRASLRARPDHHHPAGAAAHGSCDRRHRLHGCRGGTHRRHHRRRGFGRGIRGSASARERERIGGGILTAYWRPIGVTVTWC